jgi:hypothetical protein
MAIYLARARLTTDALSEALREMVGMKNDDLLEYKLGHARELAMRLKMEISKIEKPDTPA